MEFQKGTVFCKIAEVDLSNDECPIMEITGGDSTYNTQDTTLNPIHSMNIMKNSTYN